MAGVVAGARVKRVGSLPSDTVSIAREAAESMPNR